MTKLGRSRRISQPQRKLLVTVLIGIVVLGALIGRYYSPTCGGIACSCGRILATPRF